jgi:predicted nucleotidyltransferase
MALELGADQRTIRRAVERGAIRAERQSPRRITIDNGEVDYLRAHWSDLQTLQRALRTEPNVAAAILFGSFARGIGISANSDVDILVELRVDTATEAARLEERLRERLGIPVQIVRSSRTGDAPDLLLNVLEDGRPLVDRSGAWSRLKRRRKSLQRASAARRARIDARLAEEFGIEFVGAS